MEDNAVGFEVRRSTTQQQHATPLWSVSSLFFACVTSSFYEGSEKQEDCHGRATESRLDSCGRWPTTALSASCPWWRGRLTTMVAEGG
jgi:hypothetical protein